MFTTAHLLFTRPFRFTLHYSFTRDMTMFRTLTLTARLGSVGCILRLTTIWDFSGKIHEPPVNESKGQWGRESSLTFPAAETRGLQWIGVTVFQPLRGQEGFLRKALLLSLSLQLVPGDCTANRGIKTAYCLCQFELLYVYQRKKNWTLP